MQRASSANVSGIIIDILDDLSYNFVEVVHNYLELIIINDCRPLVYVGRVGYQCQLRIIKSRMELRGPLAFQKTKPLGMIHHSAKWQTNEIVFMDIYQKASVWPLVLSQNFWIQVLRIISVKIF